MRALNKHLLWIDCGAAALAGTALLAWSAGFAQLHALPQELLRLIGLVNLLYACGSFTLAVQARRRPAWIAALVLANAAWATICLGLALRFAGTASAFGLAHLLGEAAFVGGLAGLEWRWRALLARGSHGTVRSSEAAP